MRGLLNEPIPTSAVSRCVQVRGTAGVMKSEPELEVVDMVEDFVKGGSRKESREVARGRRWGRVDMVVGPTVALEFVVSCWTWVRLGGNAR